MKKPLSMSAKRTKKLQKQVAKAYNMTVADYVEEVVNDRMPPQLPFKDETANKLCVVYVMDDGLAKHLDDIIIKLRAFKKRHRNEMPKVNIHITVDKKHEHMVYDKD